MNTMELLEYLNFLNNISERIYNIKRLSSDYSKFLKMSREYLVGKHGIESVNILPTNNGYSVRLKIGKSVLFYSCMETYTVGDNSIRADNKCVLERVETRDA